VSLDALAPDQRAVVQLVLQQDRSYEDLAGLLGITTDAVRERAHRGLERLAPGDAVDPGERAEVSDYLLGQQSVSGRESTRRLLSDSPEARSWAAELAGALATVARSPLPEIPSGAAAVSAEPDPEPETAVAEPDHEPVTRARPRRREATEATDEEPVVRARPRPRATSSTETDAPTDKLDTAAATSAALARDGERPRSSLFGGALLLGGVLILVVALIIWLVKKGDDDEPTSASTGTQATATATAGGSTTGAAGDFQQIGQLELTGVGGSEATGRMAVYANTDQPPKIAFQLVGQNVPQSGEGEAYGVWLTGGDAPHFLGYAPRVAANGRLGTSGPRDQDSENFLQWLTTAKKVVVTKETEQGASKPGEVILEGDLSQTSGGQSGATPEPSP
jgi:hypothetical protein